MWVSQSFFQDRSLQFSRGGGNRLCMRRNSVLAYVLSQESVLDLRSRGSFQVFCAFHTFVLSKESHSRWISVDTISVLFPATYGSSYLLLSLWETMPQANKRPQLWETVNHQGQQPPWNIIDDMPPWGHHSIRSTSQVSWHEETKIIMHKNWVIIGIYSHQPTSNVSKRRRKVPGVIQGVRHPALLAWVFLCNREVLLAGIAIQWNWIIKSWDLEVHALVVASPWMKHGQIDATN